MGLTLTGIALVAGMIAWCHFVPEDARLRTVIAAWAALAAVDVGLFFLNRAFALY